jgi:hypothetical protein
MRQDTEQWLERLTQAARERGAVPGDPAQSRARFEKARIQLIAAAREVAGAAVEIRLIEQAGETPEAPSAVDRYLAEGMDQVDPSYHDDQFVVHQAILSGQLPVAPHKPGRREHIAAAKDVLEKALARYEECVARGDNIDDIEDAKASLVGATERCQFALTE